MAEPIVLQSKHADELKLDLEFHVPQQVYDILHMVLKITGNSVVEQIYYYLCCGLEKDLGEKLTLLSGKELNVTGAYTADCRKNF